MNLHLWLFQLKNASKNSDHTYLIIQKDSIRKDIFSVYDTEENVKYYVEGRRSAEKVKVNFRLLDEYKRPVGIVKKTIISRRNPVFHETTPADYVIEINGRKAATLKTKLSATKEDYDVEPFSIKRCRIGSAHCTGMASV